MRFPILSPSLLSADFSCLAEELANLEKANIKWLHLDVMDGAFVPNITFGSPVIHSIRSKSQLFFDVHLMIEKPERYLEDFAKSGADLLVIHQEATTHPLRALQKIHELGLFSGLAINPGTGLDSIGWLAPYMDLLLVMGVNPGFSGQKFIPATIDKISAARSCLDDSGYDRVVIQVDGGVNPANTPALMDAGADVIVSGSAFFVQNNYTLAHEAFTKQCSNETDIIRPSMRVADEWSHVPAKP